MLWTDGQLRTLDVGLLDRSFHRVIWESSLEVNMQERMKVSETYHVEIRMGRT